MKIYEVVSLNERNHPSAADIADMKLVVDKRVFPDGKIRVRLPDGEIMDFRNQKQLAITQAEARRRMANNLTGFNSLKRLALRRLTWWPAVALQTFEAVETAMYELSTPTGNPQAALEEIAEAATTIIAAAIAGVARRAVQASDGINWIRRLMTAKRSAQMATAALGAAGFVTGGWTWIGALITGAGWIATEIALYFAAEYFVDELMEAFFDPVELEEEIRNELRDDLGLLLGLTRDARYVDNDGDGEPDNIDPDTGRTTDPETGQEYKYELGDLTDDDIDKLLNAPPEVIDKLAQDPKYADYFKRYNRIRNRASSGRGGTKSITSFEKPRNNESISEDKQKVPDETDLKNFVKYLDDQGYPKSLQRQVMQVSKQKLN